MKKLEEMTEHDKDMIFNIPRSTVVQCNTCKHRGPSAFKCKAFPEGIPKEIIEGKHNHEKTYPGDNGILYEPKK